MGPSLGSGLSRRAAPAAHPHAQIAHVEASLARGHRDVAAPAGGGRQLVARLRRRLPALVALRERVFEPAVMCDGRVLPRISAGRVDASNLRFQGRRRAVRRALIQGAQQQLERVAGAVVEAVVHALAVLADGRLHGSHALGWDGTERLEHVHLCEAEAEAETHERSA